MIVEEKNSSYLEAIYNKRFNQNARRKKKY